MLECNVKVIDPEGHPVEEAIVFSTGLRSRERPGAHLLMDWLMKVRIKTDENGIAKMPYPKFSGKGSTIGTMTWSVQHPDFVNYREDHSVDDDPAEIVLQRGFRIAVSAKRALSGEKIKENLSVASFAGGGEWELKKNGMLVSGTVKKQDGVIRVVCFEPGEPTLFSSEIKVKPGDKGRVLLKDIELELGCRLEGKLADSVKRPVDGYVIAKVIRKPNSVDRRMRNWSDEAKIEPDGTFVFESLPSDEVVQMIPICDNYVPAKPKAEEILGAMPSLDEPERVQNQIDHFAATPQVLKIDRA